MKGKVLLLSLLMFKIHKMLVSKVAHLRKGRSLGYILKLGRLAIAICVGLINTMQLRAKIRSPQIRNQKKSTSSVTWCRWQEEECQFSNDFICNKLITDDGFSSFVLTALVYCSMYRLLWYGFIVSISWMLFLHACYMLTFFKCKTFLVWKKTLEPGHSSSQTRLPQLKYITFNTVILKT